MLVLDNIIFSLQRSGGISVVWSELLKRLQLGNLNFECLEYDVMSNINRRQLNLNSKSVQVRKKRFISIMRNLSFILLIIVLAVILMPLISQLFMILHMNTIIRV